MLKLSARFVGFQIGAFLVILGLMWLAVVQIEVLEPESLYAFPFIYLVFLGVSLLAHFRPGRSRRKSS